MFVIIITNSFRCLQIFSQRRTKRGPGILNVFPNKSLILHNKFFALILLKQFTTMDYIVDDIGLGVDTFSWISSCLCIFTPSWISLYLHLYISLGLFVSMSIHICLGLFVFVYLHIFLVLFVPVHIHISLDLFGPVCIHIFFDLFFFDLCLCIFTISWVSSSRHSCQIRRKVFMMFVDVHSIGFNCFQSIMYFNSTSCSLPWTLQI